MRINLFSMAFAIGICWSISSCSTSIKLGYKNLKSGNWTTDTTHVAFANLPIDVKEAFDAYYKKAIYDENSSEEVTTTSEDFIYYTKGDIDSVCKYVNYSTDYSTQNRWGPFGLYFTVANKKFMVHYHERIHPIIYNNFNLFYPSGIYVNKSAKSDFEYINFVGYNKMFYVKHKLDWLKKME